MKIVEIEKKNQCNWPLDNCHWLRYYWISSQLQQLLFKSNSATFLAPIYLFWHTGTDGSRRINSHPSQTPGQLQNFELIIDPVAAPWVGQVVLSPSSVGYRTVKCRSIQSELWVAVLQKHCAALCSASTWKHLSGSSLIQHGKPIRANTEPVIRDSFNIDRCLCQYRNNTVDCGVFFLSFFFFDVFHLFQSWNTTLSTFPMEP